MQDGNYIKINRNILEWEWYKNINTCRLFLHMILKANWKDGKFEGKEIKRGSFVSSVKNLALETELTEREIRTGISHLKKTGEVTSKATNKYTIFTVVNYNIYQANDKQNDKQETNNRHSNDILTTTIEEKKKGKKERNINYTEIINMYNDTCVSFPKCTKLSEKRKAAIRARMNIYTPDDFKQLFALAEQSDFLKGGNNRNWSASFDWLIADSNMAKVLDGNYSNKGGAKVGRPNRTDEKGLVDQAVEQGIGTNFTGF